MHLNYNKCRFFWKMLHRFVCQQLGFPLFNVNYVKKYTYLMHPSVCLRSRVLAGLPIRILQSRLCRAPQKTQKVCCFLKTGASILNRVGRKSAMVWVCQGVPPYSWWMNPRVPPQALKFWHLYSCSLDFWDLYSLYPKTHFFASTPPKMHTQCGPTVEWKICHIKIIKFK